MDSMYELVLKMVWPCNGYDAVIRVLYCAGKSTKDYVYG